ncbi:MAG: hypothetical protein OEV85_05585 [Candidatus Thorarchaeota archaeon]|nr:hypothetical protein [Candidatus Thorarchaeota archaeon]
MGEEPTCPYCGTIFKESIPEALQGSIQIRCPECDSIFAFTSGAGSFPIEDDLGLHITRSRLGARVSIGDDMDSFGTSSDTLSRTFFCTCMIIIGVLIIATVLLMIFVGGS